MAFTMATPSCRYVPPFHWSDAISSANAMSSSASVADPAPPPAMEPFEFRCQFISPLLSRLAFVNAQSWSNVAWSFM